MRVTLDHGMTRLTPVCHEPNDAPCHLMCPEGCEVWGPGHEHELEPTDICNIVEWLTADGPEEFCDEENGEVPLRDGMPIKAWFDDDAYYWAPLTQTSTS